MSAPDTYDEIYAVDAASGRGQMIFGYRAARDRELAWGGFLARVRGDDRHFLVVSTHFRDQGDRIFSVYKVDAYSGVRTLVTASPAPGSGFLVDENGEPRIFLGSTVDVRPRHFYREPGGRWTEPSALQGFTAQSS